MTHATPERTADEEQEGTEDHEEDRLRDTGGPPPTAARLHITEMQHWIDLCA